MRDALLYVLLPSITLGVSTLGFFAEFTLLSYYDDIGHKEAFSKTITFVILPVLILFFTTVFGVEKAKDDDPSFIKKNVILRAIYYSCHIKMFSIYISTVITALLWVFRGSPKDPCKNLYQATQIRRYLAAAGLGPQIITQITILLSRVTRHGGLTPEDDVILDCTAALVLSMACSLAMQHVSDKVVDFDSKWNIRQRLFCTIEILIWKILLITGRGVAMAMFSLIYGSPAIAVLVNGIGVLMVFVACAHPANSVYSVVYSFTQVYDINDVWVNAISGHAMVQFVYYFFRLAGDVALIAPFFLDSAYDALALPLAAVVFGCYAGGLLLRIFYYMKLHPKMKVN